MKFKGLNIYIILLSVVFILILYFASVKLYDYYNIKTPLENELMKINGTQNVLIEEGDKLNIKIELKSNNNLYEVYQNIYKTSKSILGDKKFEIVLDSKYSTDVQNMYYNVHYYLYEGYETKKYKDMKENIDKIMKKSNYDYLLWIDEKRLYFQINDSSESLYKIIDLDGGESNG